MLTHKSFYIMIILVRRRSDAVHIMSFLFKFLQEGDNLWNNLYR